MPKDDPSISEQIFKGIGDAITDIREKAVEEPWFGRTATDRDSTPPQWPAAKEPEQAPNPEQSREQEKAPEKEPDRDIDR